MKTDIDCRLQLQARGHGPVLVVLVIGVRKGRLQGRCHPTTNVDRRGAYDSEREEGGPDGDYSEGASCVLCSLT